jgi:hypothetical protein
MDARSRLGHGAQEVPKQREVRLRLNPINSVRIIEKFVIPRTPPIPATPKNLLDNNELLGHTL